MAARKLRKGNPKGDSEAMWQFLIDHAVMTENGFKIQKFTIGSKQEFFGRLSARRRGWYRYSEESLKNKNHKKYVQRKYHLSTLEKVIYQIFLKAKIALVKRGIEIY